MFKHITIAIGVVLLTAGVCLSAPGDLDLTFGTNGYVLYESPTDYINDEGYAIALQTDGKIVVAGLTVGLNNDVLVLRYNSDGSPDQTFGTQGVVIYDSSNSDEGYGVVIQKDGKIVVAGYSYIFEDYRLQDVLVLRYNSDGSPDQTFGVNGVVTTNIEGSDYGNAVALQPDGKIVIVGKTSSASDTYALVIRYNTDGTLDNTFGENGIVTYNGTAGGWDTLADVAIQPDGKIIATGETSPANFLALTDVLVLRYNSDGTPDVAFGANGVVTYDSPHHYFEQGSSISLQKDGRIFISGGIWDYSSYNNAVLALRYDGDGNPDSTFGTGGVATYNRGEPDFMYGNTGALLRDGRVFVAGYLNADALIVLFKNNGELDSVFSGDGIGTYSYNEYAIAHGYAMAIQTDGKIVLAGTSSYHDNYSDFAVLLMRVIGVGLPPCTYDLTPTSQSFSSTGGDGSVNVTAQSGCSWTATSNDSWIAIPSGSNGTGNGTVNYSVSANSSTSSRTGTMSIAGETFTVTQGGGCSTWTDVISKYNLYVSGQASWNNVIECYNQYVSP
jgi:uncharacterized delta-60 repeat protein